MGEAEEAQSLAFTPTWVVAAVCLVIVSISLTAEHLLHRLGKMLKSKEALLSALQRVKEELMILGFISFLLSICQNLINHICIPESASRIMLPCIEESYKAREDAAKLCKRKGEVPMLSEEALHQLHIFIFVLGVVHVLFCVTTLVLGGAKMRKWDKWDKEIQQGSLKEHEKRSSWMKSSSLGWIIAFFKQFYNSVGKQDYLVLRATFIQRHYPNHPGVDFHNYMVRALEHDFKQVVGISWYLWLFVIVFLLLNINGWHTYFWLAFLPLILLLIVGTKLQYISTRPAQEVAECSDEATTETWIKACKEQFWFSNPRAVLHLIHFILFQNSFEMAFFFWALATYGFDSCIMENKSYALSRLAIGIVVEVLCSYITLPLYAIVTHMSGDLKLEAFGEHVQGLVQDWVTDARVRAGEHTHAHQHQHPHRSSMPAHTHAHAHQHPHLRIPLLDKKRHSARGTDAEEAAAEARAAVHHAENSGMPTAPQPIDDLEEIVTTTEEDHRRRNSNIS